MSNSSDLETNGNRIGILFVCFNFIFFYACSCAVYTDIFLSLALENSLDHILILFFSLGIAIGGLTWSKLFRNIKNPYFFSFLFIPVGVSLISLALFLNLVTLIIGFIVIGFFGVTILIGNIAYIKNITKIESRGRSIGLIVTVVGGFLLISAILSVYIPNSSDLSIVISVVLIGIGCMGIVFNQRYSFGDIQKEKEIYIQDLSNRDILYYNVAIFQVFLVVGLCAWQVIVNPIMHQIASEAGALVFGGSAFTVTAMENTDFVVGLTILITALPFGLLMDRIGRTKVIILGLFVSCLGVFVFAFVNDVLTMILGWIAIGIVVSIFLNIALTVFLDIREKTYKSYIGLTFISLSTGMAAGHIIGWLTESFTFSYVALVLLETFPSAIIVILNAKDSLPSKEEREWRSCINHLFLISHTGICLVHQPFQEEKVVNIDLFAGGISGIISLVQELTKSNERIEVVSQKDKKIIIQYGKYLTGALISSKDLKILHQKLEDLLFNYEDIFHDYLKNWTGELTIFEPGIRLVKRFFT